MSSKFQRITPFNIQILTCISKKASTAFSMLKKVFKGSIYFLIFKSMIKTNHYRSRIQQRGVLQSTVDLAIAYGSKRGDKFILGKKQLRVVLAELDQLRKQVLKAVDQGGVVAVESEGCLITAYRLDSFSKALANGKST